MRGEKARRFRGFTLIELLVVISVVALLLAIILPALAASRESGNRSACLTSAKQVTVAFIALGDDNRGWVNGINRPVDANGDTDTVAPWPRLLNHYLATPPDASYGDYNALLSYTKLAGCPNVRRTANAVAFGANSAFVGWYNPPMHSLYEVRNTARIMLVADCYLSNIWQSPAALDETNAGTLHHGEWLPQRHSGEGLNVAYVDGHAGFAQAPASNASLAPWWQTGGGKWIECYGLATMGE
jgi:prepilin-type N-terminal cleavage/methylation domain-containing protein/prepilin-type processing-associated H-X9-DG protein